MTNSIVWEIIYWITAAFVFAGGLWVAKMIAEDFLFIGIVCGVVWTGLCLFGSFGIADEMFGNHPTFELRKDKWVCTQRHTEVQTTYISNGKNGMTPLVTSVVVCDQYTRSIA